MDSILSVRHLTVAFEQREVIHDLSFDLQPGDTLAVIGPNGCGKTVLLKALLGLVRFDGELRWSPGVRIGYVPQKVAADRQMPLTAQDLLQAEAHFLKLSSAEVRDTIDQVDLPSELLHTSIGSISGGQFQKVLIAYALLRTPDVLLFDEPTASLDELEEERIYQLIEALQKTRQLTILLVSHDLSIVQRSANKVLCLSKGKSCFGPPNRVLDPEILEAAYGAPLQYYRHLHREISS